jgi:hypothetical protein
MNKFYPILFVISIFSYIPGQFQTPGLEEIYIEKFYTATASDCSNQALVGDLYPGSVTYRIYVDLEPGYHFQAAYGSPSHPLLIESSENFYNHPDAGTINPNVQPLRAITKNTALLDSWISVGAASEKHLGIPLDKDMDGKEPALVYEKGYLSAFGTSVIKSDGFQRAVQLPYPTAFQIDSITFGLGMASNTKKLWTDNGAWACLGKGSCGADSLGDNKVLIAQLTTKGSLDVKLNIMIGTPDGKSLKYVWCNPETDEIIHPSLKKQISQDISTRNKKRSGKRKNSKSATSNI